MVSEERRRYKHICDLRNVLHVEDLDLSIEGAHVFLNFILEEGYLKLISWDKLKEKCKVQIPNQEIQSEFREEFTSCFLE